MKFVFSPDVILCGLLGSKHHLLTRFLVNLTVLPLCSSKLHGQRAHNAFTDWPGEEEVTNILFYVWTRTFKI